MSRIKIETINDGFISNRSKSKDHENLTDMIKLEDLKKMPKILRNFNNDLNSSL